MLQRCLILGFLLSGLSAPAAAEDTPPGRVAEDFAAGMRPLTYTWVAFAPTDPKVMYVPTDAGYIFTTTDGGISWTEARVITTAPPFYGSIRSAPTVGGVSINAGDTIGRMGRIGHGSGLDIRGLMFFDYNTTDYDFLDESPKPNAYDPAMFPGSMSNPSFLRLPHDHGIAGGGGLDARLGVGLSAAAPWLQVLLRSMGAPTAAMNMKCLLARRGMEPVFIRMVAVSPIDPRRALAATAMGVFETTDTGVSWQLLYAGSNAGERWANWIAFDPFNPDHALLATGNGLLKSDDSGERFDLIPGTQLSGAWVHSLHFDPVREGRILAGSNGGAFESMDGGASWRWIYFETLQASNEVMFVKSHPGDERVIYLATHDGIYKTRDQGVTWQRAGGLLFTAEEMTAFHVDPVDGDHLFAATLRTAWESHDGGDTWSVVYINDSDWAVRGIFADPVDPLAFWLVTTAELLRLGPRRGDEGAAAAADLIARYRAIVAASPEPALTDVLDTAYRFFLVRTGDRMRMRRLATIHDLLPRVSFEVGYQAPTASSWVNIVPWSQNAQINIPYVFDETVHKDFYWGMLVLNWNLPETVFQRELLPFGRIFHESNITYLRIRSEVLRFHSERVRLRIKLLDPGLTDPAGRIALALRYEELTQYLNAYTDGMFQEELDRLQKGVSQ